MSHPPCRLRRRPSPSSGADQDVGADTGDTGDGGSDAGVDAIPDAPADLAADTTTDTAADVGAETGSDTRTDRDTAETCADGCLIDATCYPDGVFNPENVCRYCDTDQSSTEWSDNDGQVCDDGLYCFVNDLCASGTCSGTSRDCSDGIDCTGTETCDEEADTCSPGESLCSEPDACHASTGECVSTCPGCLVEAVCYGQGQSNPAEICESCDTSVSTTSWSENEGVLCDDGDACTTDDTCSSGACDGTTRDCSDGVACTTDDVCSENACPPPVSTCVAPDVCDVEADECVTTCPGCLIEAVCYGEGQPNPAEVCEWCIATISATAWSDNNGVSCDNEDFCDGADSCLGGSCSVSKGNPCLDDGFYCTGIESCNEGIDRCVQSGDPCAEEADPCNEAVDDCCAANVDATGPYCSTTDDVVWSDSCGTEFTLDDCVDVESYGICQDGVCGCAPGRGGDNCLGCVIYVDGRLGEYTGHTGDSWGNALENLQTGLNAASASRCEVWVADGLYLPTLRSDSGDARSATFQLLTGVALYGGFAGGEFSLSQRDISGNETILSGNLGERLSDSDNAYHVVTGANNATIDGFTISDGYAYGGSSDNRNGGGMFNFMTSATVANCTFRDNRAEFDGGGMYIVFGATTTLTDCLFEYNLADSDGGGMSIHGASPSVTGCTFADNSAGHSGGGMHTQSGASPIVQSCLFSNNTSSQYGGAMANYYGGTAPMLTDTTFRGNTALIDGGAMLNHISSPTVTACTFEHNWAGQDGGGVFNRECPDDAPATVTGSTFRGNSAVGSGGGIYNSQGSSTVVGSAFEDNSAFTGGAIYDSMSSSTVSSNTFRGNSALSGGGMQAWRSTVAVANCVFLLNSAPGGFGGGILDEDTSLEVTNCIFWGNTAAVDPQIAGTPTVTYSVVEGALYSGKGNLNIDPRFLETEDGMHLSADSPCIDAGIDGAAPPTDKDGNLRRDILTVDNCASGFGPECALISDIGAYEYQSDPVCGDHAVDPGEECDDGQPPAVNICPADCHCGATTVDGTSCADILAADPGAASGVYTVNFRGASCPLNVYCDMTTDGGGWTIVSAITGADGEQALVSNIEVAGNPLLFEHYNANQLVKMASSSLSTESIFVRPDGTWIRADAPLFDPYLATPFYHRDIEVTITASDETSVPGFMGFSNYNISGGGDFNLGATPAEHMSDLVWHLNSACLNHYLYSYSTFDLDGDAGYDVNTELGSWSTTSDCDWLEGGSLSFYSGMR